jgi:hypothetical protein
VAANWARDGGVFRGVDEDAGQTRPVRPYCGAPESLAAHRHIERLVGRVRNSKDIAHGQGEDRVWKNRGGSELD